MLFGSTGTSGQLFSSFDYGHPANILDHLVALRDRRLEYVDDDSCERVLPFLATTAQRIGIWLFYAASPQEIAAAARAFDRVPGVDVRQVAGHYFVVRSRAALAPRALIRLGRSLRLRWKRAVPANPRVDELLGADAQLLASPVRCEPYGELGDPDISPHWPPVKTRHQ